MYSCKDSVHLLLEYLDGTLSCEVREQLEAHLGECPACEHYLSNYKATPKLCRDSLIAEMPAALSRQLQDFLRNQLQNEEQANDISDSSANASRLG